jgi:hypothetical protein
MPAIALTAGTIACWVLSAAMNGWHSKVPFDQLRVGEEEIVKAFADENEGKQMAR